jgi:hypothetical protein
MENEVKIGEYLFTRHDPTPKRVLDRVYKEGKLHYVLEGVGAPVCSCAVVNDVETLTKLFEETAKLNWLNRK